MNKINISNFAECDIEGFEDIDPSSLKQLEKLIWEEVDRDEQKFINIASILSNFYGDVGFEFVTKWNRS